MRRLLLLALLSTACGELDVLRAEFSDELVEAQARTAVLKVARDTTCADLLQVEHRRIETVADVIATRRTPYPVDPESGVLEDLPRGRFLVFDLSIVDAEDRQIARACELVTLPNDATEVSMTMQTLPPCEIPARGLDVAVVLDASIDMRNASLALGPDFVPALASLFEPALSPDGDRWALIVHGPTGEPEVSVPFTDDRSALTGAVERASANLTGPSRLFDAVRLATVELRSRAVCGRRLGLVVVAAGLDAGPRGGRELAIAGLAGDRRDPDDDLFGFGVAVAPDGRTALDLIFVEELGTTQLALQIRTLAFAIDQSRDRLATLLDP